MHNIECVIMFDSRERSSPAYGEISYSIRLLERSVKRWTDELPSTLRESFNYARSAEGREKRWKKLCPSGAHITLKEGGVIVVSKQHSTLVDDGKSIKIFDHEGTLYSAAMKYLDQFKDCHSWVFGGSRGHCFYESLKPKLIREEHYTF